MCRIYWLTICLYSLQDVCITTINAAKHHFPPKTFDYWWNVGKKLFMSVLQLQHQRPWWHHQQTHLSLTESMFLVASPMEMWSPQPPPHPWQIFSCSWRSTHLQWVNPVCLWWTTSYAHIIKWSESGVTFNVLGFVPFGKINTPASLVFNAAKLPLELPL